MAEPKRPKLDNWYVSNRFASEQGGVKWIEAYSRYDSNPYIKDSNPEVSTLGRAIRPRIRPRIRPLQENSCFPFPARKHDGYSLFIVLLSILFIILPVIA